MSSDQAQMRLQKFLARAGVASRRASEELILAGRVSVNGEAVCELGTKVDPARDSVAVDGAAVSLPCNGATVMLNKPAGYVTTMSDPQGRLCVADLVPAERFPGLFPVGRLDRDTTGLLLFTTDGDLGAALLHPRRHVEKRYLALVEGEITEREAQQLREGVLLSDGMTLPARIEPLTGERAELALRMLGLDREGASGQGRGGRSFHGAHGSRMRGTSLVVVGLREGRKREVRRMLEHVGHPVVALHRFAFGPLDLGDLPRGEWRELGESEVAELRRAICDAPEAARSSSLPRSGKARVRGRRSRR